MAILSLVNMLHELSYSWVSIRHVIYVHQINLHHWFLASLPECLSVQLRTTWVWVWMPDLVQFLTAIEKSLIMKGRLGTSLCHSSIFEIFLEFQHFLRSEVFSCSATHETLVHSISGDNNLAPFHLSWREIS